MQPCQNKKINIRSLTALACVCLPVSSYAVELGNFNGTDVSVKGFIKFDAMATEYSDGSLGAQSLGRDFYIPSLTPVGGESESTQVDFHAKTSRIGFGTKTDVEGGEVKTFIELDFVASAGGNERISNSYAARIRHAFLTYNNWLFGQTWTTFQNVGSLPESVDFVGNTDAGIFGRQSMIRYSNGGFQIALENPESTITPNGGVLDTGTSRTTRFVTDDNSLPDLVIRYNFKTDNVDIAVAALARQLAYTEGSAVEETVSGGGISISGAFKLGKDDLKFAINSGSGLGRYIGLNIANGAVINEQGGLEAIDSTAYYAAYRHWWNDKWRSTLSYSTIEIDNDTSLTGFGVSKTSNSARLNLMYSPTPKLTFGGEISQANREIESGLDGSMTRVQFTAKLGF